MTPTRRCERAVNSMANETPTVESIKQEFSRMLAYNAKIRLDETVQLNENYFVGKQWEGVKANGLPTPVFNFIKRCVLFAVASITTENIKMQASPMGNAALGKDAQRISDVVNRDFEQLFEMNKVSSIIREYMRNAAVDGDGCTYTYWDAELDTGLETKGGIVTEIIENTRVGFGNEAERRVQKQPYILIESREMTDALRRRAKSVGCAQAADIRPDSDSHQIDSYKQADNKTTVILRMWKNPETKTVWACEAAGNVMVREPWDMGLKLYPLTWINWDYVQNSYHGVSMLTGLVPNQDFVNKAYAMSMLSLMTTAFPKIVYDKTRVPKWDNGVGRAIGVNGGDVTNVAKIIDPAQISPQIAQFITLATEQTQTFLGATPAAMGDTRPDNTSAIIALQRAAAIPSDITKQNMFQSIEDLGRIYLDFMAANYGKRDVFAPLPDDIQPEILLYAGIKPGEMQVVEFDYSVLRDMPMSIKLDVGASSYWSEIASMQTLDNLLMQKQITLVEYLERVPEGYIPKKQELIESHKRMTQQAAPPAPAVGGMEAPDAAVSGGLPQEIPTGGGYSQLQRAISETGVSP